MSLSYDVFVCRFIFDPRVKAIQASSAELFPVALDLQLPNGLFGVPLGRERSRPFPTTLNIQLSPFARRKSESHLHRKATSCEKVLNAPEA